MILNLIWNLFCKKNTGILGSLVTSEDSSLPSFSSFSSSSSSSASSSIASLSSAFPSIPVLDEDSLDESSQDSTGASGIPLSVAAAVGGKAILPCLVMSPLNDSVDLILWFKGEEETALYSLDARSSGSFQRAKHFPSDDLSSRAYIDITGKPSTSLVFESIKASDSGVYKCRVGEYTLLL